MSNEVAIQSTRMPIPRAVAEQYGITALDWRVLVDQVFPTAKTIEAVLMAVGYCRARKLDIFKKPVHIVPMYSSALKRMVETVWPGISEIRTTAARTGEYAGIDAIEYGPMVERTFEGVIEGWGEQKGEKTQRKIKATVSYPEWASVIVYRLVQGHRYGFHEKIWWEEAYATIGKSDVPNEMWQGRQRGQLGKCVEAAALRKAFPEEVGSMYASEEMYGRDRDSATGDVAKAMKAAEPAKPDQTETAKPNGAAQIAKPDESQKVAMDAKPAAEKEAVKAKAKEPANNSAANSAANSTGPSSGSQTVAQQGSAAPNNSAANSAVEQDLGGFDHDHETGEVVDADYEEIDEAGTNAKPLDANEQLDRLETDLASAMDEVTVEEIFDQHDLLAKFDGQPNGEVHQAIAMRLKDKAMRRVRSNG